MADLVAICVLSENAECFCVSANASLLGPSDSIPEAIDNNNVSREGVISGADVEAVTIGVAAAAVVVVVEVCNVCS